MSYPITQVVIHDLEGVTELRVEGLMASEIIQAIVEHAGTFDVAVYDYRKPDVSGQAGRMWLMQHGVIPMPEPKHLIEVQLFHLERSITGKATLFHPAPTAQGVDVQKLRASGFQFVAMRHRHEIVYQSTPTKPEIWHIDTPLPDDLKDGEEWFIFFAPPENLRKVLGLSSPPPQE